MTEPEVASEVNRLLNRIEAAVRFCGDTDMTPDATRMFANIIEEERAKWR